MIDEIFKGPDDKNIHIRYPEALIATGIVKTVAATVAELYMIGEAVNVAVVRIQENARIQIQYYHNYSAHIREDIIPIVALSKAYSDGKRLIKSMCLDPEDEEEGLILLKKAKAKRMSSF